jgi:hypothetical protein
MRRVQEPLVPQAAQGTFVPIGRQDALAGLRFEEAEMGRVIDSDGEGKGFRVISDDEDWPRRQVLPHHHPMEVDQRHPLLHRSPEATVVAMLEVLTAVAVMEQTVSPERVVDRDLRSEPLECLRADASIVDAVEQSGPSDLVLVSSTWRQITGAPPSSPAHGCDASRPVPGSDSRSGDKGRCRHGSGEGADAERPAELRTPRLDAPGFASRFCGLQSRMPDRGRLPAPRRTPPPRTAPVEPPRGR